MDDFQTFDKQLNRRQFLTRTTLGLGAMAIGTLMGQNRPRIITPAGSSTPEEDMLKALPHFAPKAKRIVYLFMSGGPSQFETFDYKPGLAGMAGKGLPDSVRKGQRLTGMSANQ